MKRKLKSDERIIYIKKISSLNRDKVLIEGEIKRINFNLDFLLKHNYEKTKTQIMKEKQDIENNLLFINNNLKIMNQHLKEGVEVKEDKHNGKNKN